MIQHLSANHHFDPFHFSSSSPVKAASRSYVATRPNPYTVRSQNTFHHASLRTTAQSSALGPRLTTVTASPDRASHHQRSIDSLYSSLEAASSSSRCSYKPQKSPARKPPAPTMVKPKARPVQSLVSSVEMTAAKRSSCTKTAGAAANRRHRNVAEAAKQHSRAVATTSIHGEPSTRSSSRSHVLTSSSDSVWTSRRAATQESKPKLVIPKITVRSPTPEPEPRLDHVLQNGWGSHSVLNNKNAPVYMRTLLADLRARMSALEDGVDNILSKYFHNRRSAQPIGIELLRYVAEAVCKLYCCVKEPESELGQVKLRAISSHLFQHTVTGFFHLLEDPQAPYATASSLALVSLQLMRDFDVATNWFCETIEGPTRAQQYLKHGEIFLNVLTDELNKILDRGLALTDMENKLALPGLSSTFSQLMSRAAMDDQATGSLSGGTSWSRRNEVRKQYAREGDQRDEFVGLPVVQFIGQLVLHKIVGVQVLENWLDRFLVNTVFLGIPSVWEIECACALVISVGAMIDRDTSSSDSAWTCYRGGKGVADDDTSSSSCSEKEAEKTHFKSEAASGDTGGLEVLNKAMKRIDRLISEKQVSQQAREWLIEVRKLRERGWRHRADDLDLIKDDYSSSSSTG